MRAAVAFSNWRKFLFEPQSPLPLALFRIFFGLLTLQSLLIQIGPDVLVWYGPNGVVRPESVRTFFWGHRPHFDLFLLLPPTDVSALALWYFFIASAVLLTIGLFSRFASISLALCMISFHNHQPYNLNGGDSMLRLYAVYMMFCDSGAALSIDRLLERWRNPTFGDDSRPRLIVPWAQRLIQIQLSIAYMFSLSSKLMGEQWLNGTAVYYATRLDDLMRIPMPAILDNPVICRLLTWSTLLIEGAMASLVWFRDLRYVVLLSAIALHFGIELAINLPVFEWLFIAGFITFVYPEDLRRCWDVVKHLIRSYFGEPAVLVYNPSIALQKSLASVIEGLDVFALLQLSADTAAKELLLLEKNCFYTSHKLFCALTSKLPMLWIAAPIGKLLLCNDGSKTAVSAE